MIIRVYDRFRERLRESGYMCPKTYEMSYKGMMHCLGSQFCFFSILNHKYENGPLDGLQVGASFITIL